MGERRIAVPAVIADLIGRPTSPASSFADRHRQYCQSIRDGQNTDEICRESVCRCQREARSFLARIRCGFNPSHRLVVPTSDLAFEDNLQVQWGSQDHYEIVRKVGRGKYSEVSAGFDDLPTAESCLRTNNSREKRSSKVFTSSTTKSVSLKSSNRSRRRRSSEKSKFSKTWREVQIS